MTVHRFKLAFSQITCSGCGIDRIRGLVCADCGRRPEPWEVNAAGLGRREAAIRARTMLAGTVPLSAGGGVGAVEFWHAEVFARLGVWMEDFLRAAGAAAEGGTRGAEDLERHVTEFAELRNTVLTADDRRPLRALVLILRNVMDELASMIDAYLEALLVASPLQAQDLGLAAQRHMDRAAALTGDVAPIVDTLIVMMGQRDTANIQAGLMAQALKVNGATDMLALDSAGRDALQRLVTSSGVPGSGVLFAVNDVQARATFDINRFKTVLRRAYLIFNSNSAALQKMAASPSFERDFKRAVLELFDASMEATHVIDNAVHTRQAGRAMLGVAAALVEGPGQIMATALLLACGRKSADYENLRHQDATKLLSIANEEPVLHGLLDGLNGDLRTGRAHALVHYEQDFAVIERKSKTIQVMWADVVDGVFQGQESVLACQLALLQALGELGFTGFALDGLWSSMGVGAEQAATIVLENMGCQNIAITSTDTQWHINVTGDFSSPLPLLVAMLQPTLPKSLESLVLTAHQCDGTHHLAGPLEPWRDLSDAPNEGDAYQVAFLRTQLSWTYDDTALLPTPFVRSWVAGQVANILELTPTIAIAKLRTLRELAAYTSDDRLIWALTGAIRYLRLGAESGTTAELTQLAAWGSTPTMGPEWWSRYSGS